MAFKKTVFNEQWQDVLLNPELAGWVTSVKDNNEQAHCNACHKTFELSNMGRQALLSHAKGPNHQKIMRLKSSQPSLTSFFSKKPSNSSKDNANVQGSKDKKDTSPNVTTEASSIESFFSKEDVTRAEVIWALKVVNNKMSLRSCSEMGNTFKLMFPDSSIASQFQFGETKCSYVINHGLAPYFTEVLQDRLLKCDDYVVCFDESLNKVAQRGQMDLVVRYFDISRQKVSTQYWNSSFLGRATAENLLENFNDGLKPLPRKNLLQTSMDGPNVNLSFLKKLDEEMREENPNGKQLLNIGVCGLHVVNGAVKTGLLAAKWDLHTYLRDSYYIFKDSPARRAEYTAITGSTVFPLKHCTVRWVENVMCLERALQVFDNVKKYVDAAKLTNSKPCEMVREATHDKFIKCKLSFFKMLASECEPFLRRFQSSKPLVPFLYSSLLDLLKRLMNRCVKPNIMVAAGTAYKLISLDLDLSENLIEVNKVDLGFNTKKILKEVKACDKDILGFKLECRKVLVATIKKLVEKSPLKHKLIQGLTCLDPSLITQKPQLAQTRMNTVLEILHEANRITENVAEKAKGEYMKLCSEAKLSFNSHFQEFLVTDDAVGLDDFFAGILCNTTTYSQLWKVIKMCLILSHGNASVESGFSINKTLLVENQHEESLVAQRHIYDGIQYFGSVDKVPINSRMLQSVRAARKRYDVYLATKRQLSSEEDKRKAEKRKINDELRKLHDDQKMLRLKSQQEEEELEKKIQNLERKKSSC